MNRAEIIQALRQRGWSVAEHAAGRFELPAAVRVRYPKLPVLLVDFLSGLRSCTNREHTVWFLCLPDYEGRADGAFRWDEWEQMSVAAAGGHPEELGRVRAFWDEHLPFMHSVHDGYAYYAVCTSAEGFGVVVGGREPDFEESSPVAGSFAEFVASFLERPEAHTGCQEGAAPNPALERTPTAGDAGSALDAHTPQ